MRAGTYLTQKVYVLFRANLHYSRRSKPKVHALAHGPSGTMRPMRSLPILLLVYAFAVVVRSLLASGVPTPSLYFDEYIYSAMARSFLQFKPFILFGRWNYYPPLYSIALIPALISNDMGVSYLIMKLTNSLLISSLIFPSWFLSRRFFNQRESIIIAFLTVLMPTSNLYPAYLLSENMFVPLFQLSIFLILKMSFDDRARWDFLCGMSIALCYVTRLTGLVLVPIVFLVLMLKLGRDALREHRGQPLTAVRFIGSTLTSAIQRVLRKPGLWFGFFLTIAPWSIYNVTCFGFSLGALTGLGAQPSPEILTKLSDPGSMSWMILSDWFILHFNYVALATAVIPLSLFLFGAVYSVRRELPASDLPASVFVLEVLAAFLLLTLVAALQAYPTHFYLVGRYIDPVLPSLVIGAFLGLKRYLNADAAQTVGKLVLFGLISISILSFSPLRLGAPAMTMGMNYLLGDTSPEIGALLALLLLVTGLLRASNLKWNQAFLILTLFLAVFFIGSTAPAYSQVVSSSRYSEHELYISEWLKENGLKGVTIRFDESSAGLDQVRKQRIVYGVWFWVGYENVRISVGPTDDLTGVDYVISSRELSFPVPFSYRTNGIRYYVYDATQHSTQP